MTTASEIVNRGFREGNFNAIGQTLSAEELAEGLDLLQSIMDTVFPVTVGTGLNPWYIPQPQRTAAIAANYPALPGDQGLANVHNVQYPPPNSRLLIKCTSDTTIYFQYQPQDGAIMEYVDVNHTATVTLDANGALFGATGTDDTVVIGEMPEGRNTPRRWVYRGDLGAWVEIEELVLASTIPFPTTFDDFFVTELALRITPRGGNEPRAVTAMRNREMKTYIRNLYVQMMEAWWANPGGHRASQTYVTNYGLSNFDNGV